MISEATNNKGPLICKENTAFFLKEHNSNTKPQMLQDACHLFTKLPGHFLY